MISVSAKHTGRWRWNCAPTVEASRSKHRALLDLLLTGLLGERAQLVFTLADLDAAGIERAVPIRYLPD